MTKQCCICGEYFETNRSNRKTCGDEDCKHIQHLEYLRIYAANKRRENRTEMRKYNREWMRDYRAEQKRKEAEKVDTLIGLNYAERQKAQTLAMVGKVQI